MMRKNMAGACALGVVLAGMAPMHAHGAVTDEDLTQIRQAIKKLEQQHAEDAQHIKELEQRLKDSESRAVAAKDVAPKAQAGQTPISEIPVVTPSLPPDPQPLLSSVATPVAMSAPAQTGASASANAFNPAIGMTLMGTYSHFSHDPDTSPAPGFTLGEDAGSLGTQGFSLGESEISLSANIDQMFYGQLILSYPGEGGVEVEEGFIQTTSLPWGVMAKGGRFFSGIGYLNEQHAHAWDFLDAPLPYRVMLNNQLSDDGVQVRWTAPINSFLQFGMEGLRGEKFPATPTHDGVGAQSVFVKAGGDVNESNSWLASLAYYHADAEELMTGDDIFTGENHLGIAGLVWKWAPDGNFVERNLKLQSEFFFRRQEGIFNDLAYRGNQTGFYGQAIYQFMPRWSVGVRYDQLSAGDQGGDLAGTTLDNLGDTLQRYSSVLTYNTSEFGRFRLQYNYDDSAPQSNQGVMLNYTVSLGAHGAHQY
ncbi:MAG: hypothetical protein Q7U64_06225 [Desulfocapsaceae bacterium]|nr:hypothetical protein [Desulfocapsaceae bacterium]